MRRTTKTKTTVEGVGEVEGDQELRGLNIGRAGEQRPGLSFGESVKNADVAERLRRARFATQVGDPH
jgi:hypothetical protein